MKKLAVLLKRELMMQVSQGASLGVGITFFLSLVIIFPFGIGPDLNTLKIVGPAILWAGPLLAILLGIDRTFPPDMDDGSFDIYRMSGLPLSAIAGVKMLASWIGNALPLIALCPIFGMMLGMDMPAIMGVVLSLLIGSPAIVFFGTFCGALTARIKRAGMLTAILAVPFLIPTLIFGISTAVGYASPSLPFRSPILILIALSLLSGVMSILGCTLVLQQE